MAGDEREVAPDVDKQEVEAGAWWGGQRLGQLEPELVEAGLDGAHHGAVDHASKSAPAGADLRRGYALTQLALLDRETELAELEVLLEGARDGEGGVVVIEAGAGMGNATGRGGLRTGEPGGDGRVHRERVRTADRGR